MRFIFTLTVAIACAFFYPANAQNIFNPADPVYTYNPGAAPGTVTNPTVPPNGTIVKWVRTPSWEITWNTDNYKAYFWNGLPLRLRFPSNYNPAIKYPVILFFHGVAESGSGIYDNEYQLKWGAKTFEDRIGYGEWNGFILYPQQRNGFWSNDDFLRMNNVLDTLAKYNNADPDRLIVMGLSSGGYGSVAYAASNPQRTATLIPSCPVSVSVFNNSVNTLKYISLWLANGGLDGNPSPGEVNSFLAEYRRAGGVLQQQFYGSEFHSVWFRQWDQTYANGQYILSRYWNTAHKAQPLLYFGNNQFCPGTPINARMGLSPGFNAYEWQKNTGGGFVTIAGANSNEYTTTETGQFRARFRRTAGGAWSDWSPNPITITVKASCTTSDTLFAENFEAENISFNATGSYTRNNFTCTNGIVTNGTEFINRDGTGVDGGRFLAGYTNKKEFQTSAPCVYNVDEKVWETSNPIPVNTNTSYIFSFYLANQISFYPAAIVPKINGVALSGALSPSGEGNNSWTKYTFNWNSGNNTNATISLHNQSTLTVINGVVNDAGNEFAIDGISLTKVPAAALPVQLVSFTVSRNNNAAQLNWITAAETNNKEYVIEHSTDGNNWTSIATVAAQVNNTTKNYSYLHTKPATGINFYRLKQVDADGRYQYLPVRRIVFGKTAALLVYPNPAADIVTIQQASAVNSVVIFNQTGQVVLQQQFSTGSNTQEINISKLAKGVYILQVSAANQTRENIKLVKE